MSLLEFRSTLKSERGYVDLSNLALVKFNRASWFIIAVTAWIKFQSERCHLTRLDERTERALGRCRNGFSKYRNPKSIIWLNKLFTGLKTLVPYWSLHIRCYCLHLRTFPSLSFT